MNHNTNYYFEFIFIGLKLVEPISKQNPPTYEWQIVYKDDNLIFKSFNEFCQITYFLQLYFPTFVFSIYSLNKLNSYKFLLTYLENYNYINLIEIIN